MSYDTTTVALPNGELAKVVPGCWLITHGAQIVDVVGKGLLEQQYDVQKEGGLKLEAEDVRRLEERLGFGSCRLPAELFKAVQRLASIQVGGVEIPFTPGQMEELKHRASKRGQTLTQTVQAVIDRIKDELFWKS